MKRTIARPGGGRAIQPSVGAKLCARKDTVNLGGKKGGRAMRIYARGSDARGKKNSRVGQTVLETTRRQSQGKKYKRRKKGPTTPGETKSCPLQVQ